VVIEGKNYCKTCVEQTLTPIKPEKDIDLTQVPKLAPRYSRGLAVFGTIGFFILMVGAILVGYYGNIFYNIAYDTYLNPFGTFGYMVLTIGVLFCGLGMLGYFWSYGSNLAVVSVVLSVIFIWFLLAAELLLYTGPYFIPFYVWNRIIWIPTPRSGIYFIFLYVGSIFSGLGVILWGATILKKSKATQRIRLARTAGALILIAGLFWASYLYFIIGAFLLIPAGILGSLALLFAKPHTTP
jgi:hypothetical protein